MDVSYNIGPQPAYDVRHFIKGSFSCINYLIIEQVVHSDACAILYMVIPDTSIVFKILWGNVSMFDQVVKLKVIRVKVTCSNTVRYLLRVNS